MSTRFNADFSACDTHVALNMSLTCAVWSNHLPIVQVSLQPHNFFVPSPNEVVLKCICVEFLKGIFILNKVPSLYAIQLQVCWVFSLENSQLLVLILFLVAVIVNLTKVMISYVKTHFGVKKYMAK